MVPPGNEGDDTLGIGLIGRNMRLGGTGGGTRGTLGL